MLNFLICPHPLKGSLILIGAKVINSGDKTVFKEMKALIFAALHPLRSLKGELRQRLNLIKQLMSSRLRGEAGEIVVKAQ